MTDPTEQKIHEALTAAYSRSPEVWSKPVLPATVLIAGSLRGFSEEEAETILMDVDCRRFLNDLWTTYNEQTGRSLPPGVQSAIADERKHVGPQWNLLVAHECGWGFSDDDLENEWQESAARGYWQGAQVQLRYRGDVGESVQSGVDEEPWEVYLRTQHFVILLRSERGHLVIQVESDAKTGRYDLVLRWPDGSTDERTIEVSPTTPYRNTIGGHTGFPTSASIRG